MTNNILGERDNWVGNILLMLLFPCVYLSRLQVLQGVHVIYVQTFMSLFVFYYTYKFTNKIKVYRVFVKWLVSILIFVIANMLFVGNSGVKELLNSIIIMPSLAVLLFFYKVKWVTSFFIFYGFAMLTSCFLFTGMYSVDTLLVNSRNYISYFFVLYLIPYFKYCTDYNKTPSLIPAFICLFFSILAIGRGGILMSLLVLIGLLLFIYNKLHGFRGGVYKLLLFSLILFLFFVFDFSDFSVVYLSRFTEEGFETAGRADGWIEYLSSLLSFDNFLLGTNVYELPYLSKYLDGSLHNSYLTLHARYGIISLFIIWYMFKGFYFLLKEKFYLLALVFASLLIKGFTDADTGGNFTGGDIYVYYMLLNYISYKNSKKININESKSVGTLSASVSSNS